MKHSTIIFTLCLFTSLGFAETQGEDVSTEKLNQKIDTFSLMDSEGKSHSLNDIKDHKAIVIAFLCFDCPVSNSYVQPLSEMAKKFAANGVHFFGVASSLDLSRKDLAKQVGEFEFTFPVLHDPKQSVAKSFKAEMTPEVFVLDHNHVLRYRGRIDNGYYRRLKRNAKTTRHDLQIALDELLAGKSVSLPATKAIGCPLFRDQVTKKTGKVTYYRDVLPILQQHCQGCHRPGEVGPFSLMTYDQAVNWAEDIAYYTETREMPPWKPVAGLKFHNERKLSKKEIDLLAAWVDEKMPEGDKKDAPAPRKFTTGWQLGEPDLVLETGEMTVGAGGRDLFRCFVLPTDLPEDKYVTAIEVRPSNRRVVHHTLNFIDRTGAGRRLEEKERAKKKTGKEKDYGPGYSVSMGVGFRPQGGLGGWAPGQQARHLPEDSYYRLPKGADVVLQVHYHRTGRIEKDNTRIGLYFADKPVSKQLQGMVIPGRFLYIPANRSNYPVSGTIEVMRDCDLHTIMPHMHMLGKKIKVTLLPEKKGGKEKTLIEINDWDYNWQETYFLEKPLALKKGTKLKVEAIYDNSKANPQNPFNPPRMVWIGEQTTNEMCFVFLGATSEGSGRRIPFRIINKDGTPLRVR